MYKVAFFIHQKSGMNTQDFRSYWSGTHSEIIKKIPGLRKYVQNYAISDTEGNAPLYDGFAEVWFDDQESFAHGLASPEGQAAIADVENFADVASMQALDVQEIKIV